MGVMSDADKELTEAAKNASRAARIEAALAARFAGARIAVRDESALHAGHAGWREAGETHYHVEMSWPGFRGQSRVARHRAVMAALEGEFMGGLHALSLTLDDAS
jgi:BolA protein